MRPIFITGTDTGIGKTVLSMLLMRWFFKNNYQPFYLKPIQTGCDTPEDPDSDARFVHSFLTESDTDSPSKSVIYCFSPPKAPLFAARHHRTRIDMDRIIRTVQDRGRSHYPVIVEGAGGLMVPITKSLLMIDLIQMLHAIPVLVARAGLGTINHTLLSIHEMERAEIDPYGIVFMNSAGNISDDMIRENVEAIETVSGKQVLGVIHPISDFSNPWQTDHEIVCRKIEQLLLSQNGKTAHQLRIAGGR